MRGFSRVLLLLSVALLFAWPRRGEAQGDKAKENRQVAGKWVAFVKMELVGSPQARALSYRQQVFRQGPDDKEPVVLFEETSTGRTGLQLRDNGLLLVQPVSERPRFYFPGSKDPVELKLPPPQKGNPAFGAYTDVGKTWFLDDVLFYDRMAHPGHRLIGFVRIDAQKKAVDDGKLCLEIVEPEQAVADAAAVHPVLFRMGDHVFWVNAGHHNAFYPNMVKGEWKSRKVRVLSLKTGEAVAPDKVPEDLLKQNKDRILEFLEKRAHNKAPELEIWALDVLARVGGSKDVERLRALAGTVRETMVEVAPNELKTTAKPVKEAYAKTLTALEKKEKE